MKQSTIYGKGRAEMKGAGQEMEGAVGAHQELEDHTAVEVVSNLEPLTSQELEDHTHLEEEENMMGWRPAHNSQS